jgi:Arc-like DNA binding dprotein
MRVVALNVRLPVGLHRVLVEVARRHGRSLNAEIVERLEEYPELMGWAEIREAGHAQAASGAAAAGGVEAETGEATGIAA